MRKLLSALLVGTLLVSVAQAQIYSFTLTDEKAVKKYSKYVTEVGGKPCILFEPYTGFPKDDEGRYKYNQNSRCEVFVANPSDPSFVPYKETKNGGREPNGKKGVLAIDTKYVSGMTQVDRVQNLAGMALEYEVRLERLEALKDVRKGMDKTTREWSVAHIRVVKALESLHSWLRKSGYGPAADKLAKELKKEGKALKEGAIHDRREKAMGSVKMGEVPEGLKQTSKEVAGGTPYHVQDSQHITFVYPVEHLADAQVRELLLFGEGIIEGFRNDFVDRYLDEDFEDWIPDDMFIEFFFAPDDQAAFDGFYTEYYGMRWNEERDPATPGIGAVLSVKHAKLNYWRLSDQRDLEGIVAHQLGHALASFHFGGTVHNEVPWVGEGLGYFLSFEYLGRNSVTCKSFHKDPQGYVKHEKTIEGEKTTQMGMRELFNTIALDKGIPIEKLSLKILFEMDDFDLAKAWSLFDFFAQKEGQKGQRFLRALAKSAGSKNTLIAKWREKANAIYEIESGDVFDVVEKAWRDFAVNEQSRSEDIRRKR